MAGLLDGEGTIGITYTSKGRFRSPYISVSSTTPRIMEWLKDNFGGNIVTVKKYQDHHKQAYSWKLRTLPKIMELLENTLPYMLEDEKIRRGNMILHEYLLVTPRNGKYTPEMLVAKQDFEQKLLSL